MRDFRLEMARGLSGAASSLKMIPAYAEKPTGDEEGKFIALDLGGTNFRILELELKGKGRSAVNAVKKFTLDEKLITGRGKALFDFVARSIKAFLKEREIGPEEKRYIGFTFSFPVEQTGIAAGTLSYWTKGFSAKGVVGKDVVRLLNDALARNGLSNIKVAALTNDTTGTLMAKSYEDAACDIGVIIGTGTNACYSEELSNIPKWDGPWTPSGRMVINIEWGNFNKLRLTPYDRELDKESIYPGRQILEKMVSGMYLGELARLVIKDLMKKKALDKKYSLKSEYMSIIEGDRSGSLSGVGKLLKKLGVSNHTLNDRRLVKRICEAISTRSARISAACLAAVITKTDPSISRKHTIAIDGAVYEKHPRFSKNIRSCLKELFGNKASLIRIALTKDGSGKGAAVTAAVAAHNLRQPTRFNRRG